MDELFFTKLKHCTIFYVCSKTEDDVFMFTYPGARFTKVRTNHFCSTNSLSLC